ncbi:MAG: hypothetical protein CM1200mP1_06600 [Candidatus Neomarinimicrobiota bacterium]|nr:MAG: hypothetical protein CM1200mP1_06600 [Candidatus Neomarinimicrobiota bacterium]
MVSGLFLFGYVTVLLPVVLYTGSLALIGMFDLNLSLGVVVATIGILGSAYAIFGGLKSVAVSDTLNGVGLLIGGLAIPILGLCALGNGSFFEGIGILAKNNPEYLAVLTQTNTDGNVVSAPLAYAFNRNDVYSGFLLVHKSGYCPKSYGSKKFGGGAKRVLFASGMKLMGP